MATTYMSLVLPTDFGSTNVWGGLLNTALTAIDEHDHSSGKGTRITPAGLDISTDLDLQSNDLTSVRSVRFTNQSSALAGASDVRCLSVVGGNLYFNHSAGTVQITDGAGLNTAQLQSTALPSTAVGSNTTISAADTFIMVRVNTTSSRTITLPAISGVAAGRYYIIKDVSGASESNPITLARSGSDTIDGATSMTLSMDYGMWIVVSDGTSNWMVMRPSPDFLTKSTLTLPSGGSVAIGSSVSLSDSTLSLGNVSLSTSALTVGASSASTGAIRLPNNQGVYGRRTTADDDGYEDALIGGINTSNEVQIGTSSSGVRVSVATTLESTLSVTGATTFGGNLSFSSAQTVTRIVPLFYGLISRDVVALGDASITDYSPTNGATAFILDSGSAGLTVSNGTADYCWQLAFDITPFMPDGATLSSAVLRLTGATSGGILPQALPSMRIARWSPSSGVTYLTASSTTDSSASDAAFTAHHTITYTPTQNNTIDRDSYVYYLIIQDTGGTGAASGTRYHGLTCTFSVTDFKSAAM